MSANEPETQSSSEPATATDTLLTPAPAPAADATKADAVADADAKPAEEPKADAPEAYEFKAPEGKEYDPEVLSTFSSAARDAGLSQEAAQALLEKVAPALDARQQALVDAARETWAEETRASAEFGGAKLEENLAVAKRALDQFGTPAFKQMLNETGIGNHPEVVGLFVRMGRAISEDAVLTGKPAAQPKTAAQVLYPTMAPR
ncbi:MAG TPA: hypothetical protein DCY89_05570 [Gammaproteobacteria bacterium]|nr:hypothetical protein [Gammaproteobacteria bacterium]